MARYLDGLINREHGPDRERGRVSLAPIRDGKGPAKGDGVAASGQSDGYGCIGGYARSGGQCTSRPSGAKLCDAKDEDGCAKECMAGSLLSCNRYAKLALYGKGDKSDAISMKNMNLQAVTTKLRIFKPQLAEACDANLADACTALAFHHFAEAMGRGADLIVVDPRHSVVAGKAKHWLPIKPGTDTALLLAWMHVLLEEGLVDNAVKMGAVMRRHMQALQDKHPSVKTFRQIGLFGMVDLQKDADGTPMAPHNGAHPAMGAFSKFLRDNGLFTFIRWGSFMCNPPLCITEEQLGEAFEIIDRGLEITDRVVTG